MVIKTGIDNRYDNENYCPKCNSPNECTNCDYLDGHMLLECKTKCTKCGHENYWAHGFFIEQF